MAVCGLVPVAAVYSAGCIAEALTPALVYIYTTTTTTTTTTYTTAVLSIISCY